MTDAVSMPAGLCPVCGRPTGSVSGVDALSVTLPMASETCRGCGWVLRTPLRAGAVTPGIRRDFDSRLRAARDDQARRDVRSLETELRSLVGGLSPDATATVIDVSAGQVTVSTVYLDANGTPRVRDSAVGWTRALRTLAAGEQARLAQLAYGIPGLGDDVVADLLRDRLPPVPAGRVAVICRPAGWRVLEAAAVALTTNLATDLATGTRARLLRLSAAAGAFGPHGASDVSVSARDLLAALTAQAPLTRTYWLMAAAVDWRTGDVTPRPLLLFAAGATPGTEARLTLRRVPGDTADTALAIFASKASPGAARAAEPVALYQAPVPPGPVVRLRAVLDGPGRVRITEPAGAVPHPGTWAQVRGQVPRQVPTAAAARTDLVCAIDLAGSPVTVGRRIGLARDLLELIGAEYPEERRLRAGVITCTDHLFGRRPGHSEDDSVTSVCELGPAAKALAWLGNVDGGAIDYPPRAAVEDLLYEALQLLSASRAAGRVPLLLTIAGRRPHPQDQLEERAAGSPLPCPRNYRWRSLMDQLTRDAGVRCVVVADALPASPPTGSFPRADRRERGRLGERADWNRLGPSGQRVLAETTARQLAESLGLLTGAAQRIPLPLTDEPEGATTR